MKVLVFKTNIRYKKQVKAIQSHLHNLEGLYRWKVDLHDRDKILRIETKDLLPADIENVIGKAGYFCEELLD